MICHHFKCLFVHIPKNAGQSIEHVFLEKLGLDWKTRAPLLLRANDQAEIGPPKLAHLMAEEYVRFNYIPQDMFDAYFKFAFVRNPWSRMVSMYNYLGYNYKCSFDTFINKEFPDKVLDKKYWFVRPQSDFIYSDNDKPLVDFIGRFEELQKGFDLICNEIGFPQTQLPHVNNSSQGASKFVFTSNPKKLFRKLQMAYGKNRFPKYKNYQQYYNKNTIDSVARLYQRDIELFEYTFDQPD